MSRRHRASIRALALFAAAVGVLSCDMTVAPGVFSLSKVLLPSPGMVVGDTLRDSTGAVAPLRVIAYAGNGDTVAATPYFITLDTVAHLAGGNLLIGDITGTVRIIGGVNGVTTQTLPESVKVTLSPDSLVANDSVRHVKTYSILTDTIATSADLTTLVQHTGTPNTPVDAVIVRYDIVSAPPSKNTQPTVVLLNGNIASSRDTTVGGKAARTVRLRINNLTTVDTDSAVVTATASYRGVSIGTVTFTVVFQKSP